MRISYDSTVDAAYIYLMETEPGSAVSEEHVAREGGEIILDFNRDGHLLGIEILGAIGILPPDLLAGNSG